MQDRTPSPARVGIERIVIRGARADTRATSLDRAIRQGLARVLGRTGEPAGGAHSGHIPRVRLRLPPRATEAEIAEAVARAVAGARGGERT